MNSVLVPVVVRDAHGRAVGDLTQKDFALFDQDKPVAIAGFSVQKRAAGAETVPTAERSANAAAPNAPPASTNAAPRAAQPTATPERFVVFLFDDLHFDPSDLLRIKNVATKMLGQSVGDSDMAASSPLRGRAAG